MRKIIIARLLTQQTGLRFEYYSVADGIGSVISLQML